MHFIKKDHRLNIELAYSQQSIREYQSTLWNFQVEKTIISSNPRTCLYDYKRDTLCTRLFYPAFSSYFSLSKQLFIICYQTLYIVYFANKAQGKSNWFVSALPLIIFFLYRIYMTIRL